MSGRFARFVVAGSGGFVVQLVTVAGLLELNVHYLVAIALGVEAAIIVNFFAHQMWTWRDRSAKGADGASDHACMSALERFVRYHALVSLTSIFGSIFLSAYFVEATGLHPLVANVASIAALSVVNFVSADRLVFKAGMVLAMLGVAGSASASGDAALQPKTVREFNSYAAAVESRRVRELTASHPFLDIERQPAPQLTRTLAALRRGDVIVATAFSPDLSEVPIDGGLINHWRGSVLVPRVTLDHLLKVLQGPSDQHQQDDVIRSRVVARGADAQSLFLRIKRTKIVTVMYDTEYDVTYKRLARDRAISTSLSTRIVEIENAGTARERAMPEGNDHGYMWRLNSYWRYKQLGNGVVVEVESLSLSRDLPPIIGPLIRPIVSGVARDSITRTLVALRARFQGATM
ncbi:MAG: GtrA family protein [Acidimicrobiia bacterium]